MMREADRVAANTTRGTCERRGAQKEGRPRLPRLDGTTCGTCPLSTTLLLHKVLLSKETVLWIRNDFFSNQDPTFQLVSDPAPDQDPVSDPTQIFSKFLT
jgi:hypothetical protein